MIDGKKGMGTSEIYRTLACISTYQETLNQIAHKDMPVKKVCSISAQCIDSIGVIANEFNDVITTLSGSDAPEDKIYRAAFSKALEIVMRASHYRREKVS